MSCSRILRTPAWVTKPSSTRAKFRGSITVPMVDVKTSPLSSQYRSSAARSASCRFRCSSSTLTVTAGSGMSRRELADFGGPKTMP